MLATGPKQWRSEVEIGGDEWEPASRRPDRPVAPHQPHTVLAFNPISHLQCLLLSLSHPRSLSLSLAAPHASVPPSPFAHLHQPPRTGGAPSSGAPASWDVLFPRACKRLDGGVREIKDTCKAAAVFFRPRFKGRD